MRRRSSIDSSMLLATGLLFLACGGGGGGGNNGISGGQTETTPVARIYISASGGPAPLVVQYSGTSSTNPDGGTLAYLWEFSQGETSTTPTGTVTFPDPGTFTIRLTVTDESGHSDTEQTTLTISGNGQESFAHRVLYLTNLERKNLGVPPLKGQFNLEDAAYNHALDMGQQNYFDHDSLDGRSPWARIEAAGYSGNAYAENIAAGYDTPDSVLAGWINSSGHYANIKSASYRELGVGYCYWSGSDYTHYWVQDFGARSGVYPVVIENELFSTTNPAVNLYIYGTGWASQMMISEDPNFTGVAWQAFSATPQIQLSAGTGLKHVYVRIKNSSDTIKTATDEIVLQ